jgi:hypothetical protein
METFSRGCRRVGAHSPPSNPLILGPLAFLILSALVPPGIGFAQGARVESLAARSAVVVRGKVLRTNASDEPMLPASNRTAIISVQEMYAGSEIAGDQKGRNATVILSRPDALKPGQEAIFFGAVRFLGKSMTIADDDEIPAQGANASPDSALQRGVQARKDGPILERLAAASVVFRGTVEDVRRLEPGAEQTQRAPPPTEHDPEWQAATVRIDTPLRGGQAGQKVTIVFAGSRDITWFNSPKLKPGQEAVFLARTPTKEEATMYRASALGALLQKQRAYLVTEPNDVLPPAEEARVRALLPRAKEKK